jgi:DNA end-binding protein Ku
MPRAIVTAVLTFGLVSVPIKVYASASPSTVSFCMVTPKGNRVKQTLVDAVDGSEVDRATVAKGFEYAKDKLLVFTQDEIKAMESVSDKAISIKEFVKGNTVDPVGIEKSYFLGPDKGGDRGFLLLASTLAETGKVAVAQWSTRGRDKLIVIAPTSDGTGLFLHEMFYADEVRDIKEIDCAKLQISDAERSMASKLIEALSTDEGYDASQYEDGFRMRVKDAIERKVLGQAPLEVTAPVVAPVGLDMLAALQASIEAAAASRKPRKPKAEKVVEAAPEPKAAKPKKGTKAETAHS